MNEKASSIYTKNWQMENFRMAPHLILIFTSTMVLFSRILVQGQIITPCTSSMITSFTPCFGFITGSSANGGSPTTDCCESFKNIMDKSVDCGCLLITANVPVSIPFSPSISLNLPRACNMGGVPLQCQAQASTLPASGPASLGPTLAPTTTSLGPTASKVVAIPPSPETEITPSPSVEPETQSTTNAGIKPVLTPAASSYSALSPSVLLIMLESFIVLLVKGH